MLVVNRFYIPTKKKKKVLHVLIKNNLSEDFAQDKIGMEKYN